MQTGAFLQTILTLSAITCRLHAVTKIVLEIHEDLTTTLLNLSESLEVRFCSGNHRSLPNRNTLDIHDFGSFGPSINATGWQVRFLWTTCRRPSTWTTGAVYTGFKGAIDVWVAVLSRSTLTNNASVPVAIEPIADEHLAPKADQIKIKLPEQPKPLAKDTVAKIKKKKKKTPRNEIDAIFDL